MSTLVVVLRVLSVVAFAGPMMLMRSRRRAETGARRRGADRAPLIANLIAVGLFLPSLLFFSLNSADSIALLLALSGFLVATAGASLGLGARAELGAAWSLLPEADQGAGLITTGPYRIVRHPIYLGFSLLAFGQALAFGSGLALVVVLCGIVPTFAWRARAEETLLSETFGERHAAYRQQTRKMIIPYVI